jgi:hypothetical protein
VVGVPALLPGLAPAPPFVPTSQYDKQAIEGWTVLINRRLLAEKRELGQRALRLLAAKLVEVTLVVPPRRPRQGDHGSVGAPSRNARES